jgi:D-2-hydroxyacid dehydrogenase (NADP+)
MPKILVFISPRHDPSNSFTSGLAGAFPGLEIVRVGDEDAALREMADTEVLVAFATTISARLIAAGRKLRWVQALTSGIDGIVKPPGSAHDILLTTARGAQATPVSEAVLAFLLALSRDLPRLVRNQMEHRWERFPARLLKGQTVVVLGVGAIAECLAPKCAALGLTVIGLSHQPREVAGFAEVRGMAELLPTVAEADYLVVLAPLTPASRGLVGEQVLRAMRPSASLVNVARGPLVDEAALVEALQQGRIAGAALDVFVDEPLPAERPLWSMPNVLVSPHLAGFNVHYIEDVLQIVRKNLRLWLEGDVASMRNRVEWPAL